MGVKLIDNKEKVIKALREQVANGLNDAANHFANEARNNANVDTEFMKSAIGQTVPATANSLFTVIRSLAPYSGPQDTGQRGNLFWTWAYLATRERFKQFMYGKGTSAGPGVIKAAQTEYHGVTGRKGQGF